VTAKQNSVKEVTLWGTGTARREFLHSADLASAVLVAMDKFDDDMHLNVGNGKDLTIQDLASKIASISGFEGQVLWDKSKPDGTPQKVLDVSRLMELGWSPKVTLDVGIAETIQWFKENWK
jgi:GDP-L-fucose synthase